MKKKFPPVLIVLVLLSLLTACGRPEPAPEPTTQATAAATVLQEALPAAKEEPAETAPLTEASESQETQPTAQEIPVPGFSLDQIPEFSGQAYVAVNGNVPYFGSEDLTAQSYERYSPLDSLGRCGPAIASIGTDLMPTEERGPIGMVKPTGWHTVKYDFVDGKYLYNRCHLIGFQLTGENANVENLITGTRYLNIEGMLPFENMVADYVKETGNHVLYRVTPVFEENDLLSRGVLLEGQSVEDGGSGIRFCVFAYNVQPGANLSYKDGSSTAEAVRETQPPAETEQETEAPVKAAGKDYIGNKNTKKFHVPHCSSVGQMKESNKYYFTGDRQELINQGYVPCKRCHP